MREQGSPPPDKHVGHKVIDLGPKDIISKTDRPPGPLESLHYGPYEGSGREAADAHQRWSAHAARDKIRNAESTPVETEAEPRIAVDPEEATPTQAEAMAARFAADKERGRVAAEKDRTRRAEAITADEERRAAAFAADNEKWRLSAERTTAARAANREALLRESEEDAKLNPGTRAEQNRRIRRLEAGPLMRRVYTAWDRWRGRDEI